MINLTVTLLVVALSLFYYYCIRPMSFWKQKGIEQTQPLWLFGDMFKTTFRRQAMHEWICDLYNKFPSVRYFGMYQFVKPTLILRDPELIKKITVKDFDHFVDHRTIISEKADPLWANNLVALKGQKWRDMRPILSPSFTSSKMKNMFVLMSDCGKNFTEFFLEKNKDVVEVEFKDIFTRYCNDVIATSAFGIETNSLRQPDNEFYKMGKEATNFTGLWQTAKLFFIMMAPDIAGYLNIQFFGAAVKNFFYNLIDETVKAREEKNIIRPDMIHLLMQARKGYVKQENENGVIEAGFSAVQETHVGKAGSMKITNKEIASQAMIFFFGGFESVSTLMCFICYELAANPEVQSRLREEVEETLTKCNGQLTYDALLRMKYLDMVVSETLRKWPVAAILDRVCTKPYTIEPVNTNEQPVHLNNGDLIWIPVFAIHHDEKYYPNPEKFDPERFSDENKGNINPDTYLPFGAGPRNCIGSRFALLENKAVIFHLLSAFEIVPTAKSKIPIVISKAAFQLIADGGFWFGLKRLRK